MRCSVAGERDKVMRDKVVEWQNSMKTIVRELQ